MPTKKSKSRTVIVIVIFSVLIILGVKLIRQQTLSSTQTQIPPRAKGNPKAAVHVIEYMDFQCPACAKGALQLSNFMKENPDKLYLEARYFPLDRMHAHAVRSARYAECAARQGKFWPVHDALFLRQEDWHGLINADTIFMEIATQAQVDLKKLDVCLADESIGEIIIKDKEDGQKLGVKSTPSYFVNGKMVVGINSLEEELLNAFGRVKN